MRFSFALITLIILTSACQHNKYIPDLSEQIDYKYKVIVYTGFPDNKDIFKYQFFNKNDQLIEEVGFEYRIKYFYEENGRLKETIGCRVYNCDIGWRSILVYDSLENHIGTYITIDTLVNMDTVTVEQLKFYSNNNHLIKELSQRGTDVNGKDYEVWKFYFYDNDLLIKEIELQNNDTIWVGKYTYDEKRNLQSIKRQRKDKFENETFEYDQSNCLIKESIESNEWPLTKHTSFSVNNKTITYKYNKKGQLIEKTTFNHKGEEYLKFTYVYKDFIQNHRK